MYLPEVEVAFYVQYSERCTIKPPGRGDDIEASLTAALRLLTRPRVVSLSLWAFIFFGVRFRAYMKRATRTPESAGEQKLDRLLARLHSLAQVNQSFRCVTIILLCITCFEIIILFKCRLPLASNESKSKSICRVQMTWGPGEAPAAAPSASRGGGGGLVTAEDVVLPPQADSWMKAAVQQELMREQMQHEQPHHYQQQQQQQLYQQQGDGGVGGSDIGGVDLSQQPLLNAQVHRFFTWSLVSFPRFLVVVVAVKSQFVCRETNVGSSNTLALQMYILSSP